MASFYIDKLSDIDSLPVVSNMEIICSFASEKDKDVPLVAYNLAQLKNKGCFVSFFIDVEKYNPSDKDIAFYKALHEALAKEGISLKFSGGHKDDYSLAELIKADAALDAFIKQINDSVYSPFEKYILIYDYLSKRKYKEDGPSKEDNYLSRDIISVMNSDYIVCEGFANLMDYLCQNVGIKCLCQGLKIMHKGEEERHMNNLVKIDDDIYDIHGLYYSDVTWDSSAEGRSLVFCLIPLGDHQKMDSIIIPEPFYQIFYRKPNVMMKYLDRVGNQIIGENACFSLPFRYDYVEGCLEEFLHMQEEVKSSYEPALQMFLKNRHHAITVLKDMLKRKGVPENAYLGSHFTPYGCALPALIATLIVNDRNLLLLDQRIDTLLKHMKNPANKEGEVYQYEDMVYYHNPNVYKTLDILNSLSDTDVNLSMKNLAKRKVQYYYSPAFIALPFDEAAIRKFLYDEVSLIINDIRIMMLFNKAKEIVDKEYPIGKPIAVEKYQRALINIFERQGDKPLVALQKADEAVKRTTYYAEKVYSSTATNCFRQATLKK